MGEEEAIDRGTYVQPFRLLVPSQKNKHLKVTNQMQAILKHHQVRQI